MEMPTLSKNDDGVLVLDHNVQAYIIINSEWLHISNTHLTLKLYGCLQLSTHFSTTNRKVDEYI